MAVVTVTNAADTGSLEPSDYTECGATYCKCSFSTMTRKHGAGWVCDACGKPLSLSLSIGIDWADKIEGGS